jgi:hypothetical protein
MSRKREGKWLAFSDYLKARGVAHCSTGPYLSHVRKLTAAVEPLTVEGIEAYLGGLPDGSMSTARCAYRAFADFARSTALEGYPELTPAVVASPPQVVLEAIGGCISAGVSRTVLSQLAYTPMPQVTIAGMTALSHRGKIVLLPTLAVDVLLGYFNPTRETGLHLIPRKRGAHVGVASSTISRWLRETSTDNAIVENKS